MSELGETLRRARLESGMTLEELEEVTKIRKRYLEAIEEQNFNVLPGNFYVRAFIKNYAEAVGVNPDDILDLYKNVIPSTDEGTDFKMTRSPAKKANFGLERWSKWAAALLMICFFLLIVTLIYFYFYQSDSDRDTALDETPLTESQLTDDETNETETETNQEPVVPADPESEIETEPEPELTLVSQDGDTDIYTLAHMDTLVVEVEIVGAECWLSVRRNGQNGEEIFMDTLTHGDTETWEHDGPLWIRFGQASSASVTVNGIELEPYAQSSPRNLQLNLARAEANLSE